MLTLGIVSWRLSQSVSHMENRSFSYIKQMGFGATTSESITKLIDYDSKTYERALLENMIIANLPQAVLSLLFFCYNSLYTCMLMANEWDNYAQKRKHLRVTDPIGQQRSTYRLQLPYKYSIPLLVLSAVLHFLVSQSIFMVAIAYNARGDYVRSSEYVESFTALGYSCIAIISTIALSSLALLLGVIMGFRRYGDSMPLVGSCSAAISAACHQPMEDQAAADKALLWGVPESDGDTDHEYGNCRHGQVVGHCSFTSFSVSPPQEGRLYA